LVVAPKGSRFKYEERPPPCRRCGRAAWWNGWRAIKAEVVCEASGANVVREARRHRARCSSGDRSCRIWTVYGEDAYPHRVFQLSVVASAVGAVALGGLTLSGSAARHRATRRSVSRWLRWVATLLEAPRLLELCARLDAQGQPPPPATVGKPATIARAGAILRLLDQLARLLRERGVRLARDVPALAAIVAHQLARFGEVRFLTRSSPPLRVDVVFEPP
jgi:hypothetical protein